VDIQVTMQQSAGDTFGHNLPPLLQHPFPEINITTWWAIDCRHRPLSITNSRPDATWLGIFFHYAEGSGNFRRYQNGNSVPVAAHFTDKLVWEPFRKASARGETRSRENHPKEAMLRGSNCNFPETPPKYVICSQVLKASTTRINDAKQSSRKLFRNILSPI
jgi:hypothetical protein